MHHPTVADAADWSPRSSISYHHSLMSGGGSSSRRRHSTSGGRNEGNHVGSPFITFRRLLEPVPVRYGSMVAGEMPLGPSCPKPPASSSDQASLSQQWEQRRNSVSVSSMDTVEMAQTMLQSMIMLHTTGSVRFSPVALGSAAAAASNFGHGPSSLPDPPMAPLRSMTPTAAAIQSLPWSVLTTSGGVLAPSSKVHCDGVERWVDNVHQDLVVFRGMILLGWLQVIKLLGSGTFGQVFLCRDLRLGKQDEPEYTSSGSQAMLNFAHGGDDFLSCTDWGGEDYQYFQCTHDFLPEGEIRRRPLTPRLVAVKIVKSIATFEMQSSLEADILVRAASATASFYREQYRTSAPSAQGSELLHLEEVPLMSTVNTHSDVCDAAATPPPPPPVPTHNNGSVPPGGIGELLAHGLCYGHHCLVMMWYGENLYEFMKRQQPEPQLIPGTNQYAPVCRGLHLDRIRVVGKQLLEALVILHDKMHVCHGDVKPENIMLEVSPTFADDSYVPAEEHILNQEERQRAMGFASPSRSFNESPPPESIEYPGSPHDLLSNMFRPQQRSCGMSAISTALAAAATAAHMSDALCACPPLKMTTRLIDLGSAFASNKPMFVYIQSRYYRAPEVILGAPYGTAIDVWSVGCVLAEMLLGLPLLPGIDNFHQIQRIVEMFGPLPQSMLSQGKDTPQYYRCVDRSTAHTPAPSDLLAMPSLVSPGQPQQQGHTFWELRTEQDYYRNKNVDVPVWRPYFQFRKLHELVQNGALSAEEREEATMGDGKPNLDILKAVGHKRKQLYEALLKMLAVDPSKRISASAALQLPFFASLNE